MRKYTIVTESGSDLSDEIVKKHHIQMLPMHVLLGDKGYPDGAISIEELCGYYEKTGKVPTTSAVNPDEYRKALEKIRAEDPDTIIIHISYSSLLSSTFQNSMIADEGMSNVYHIDALNVSAGLGLVVIKTIQLIEKTPDIAPEDLVELVKKYANSTKFSFIPGNLDYLRAGGRVSNAQYLGAIVLRLKPLIEVSEGKLLSTKKYRGSLKRIVKQMINDFFAEFHNVDKSQICVVYVYEMDKEIKEDIEKYAQELGIEEIIWLKAGAVITSHSGPGGIGIAGIEKTTTL